MALHAVDALNGEFDIGFAETNTTSTQQIGRRAEDIAIVGLGRLPIAKIRISLH
jgi:hypothetical protein